MGDEHPDNPHPDADGDVTRPDGGPAPEEDVTEGGTVDPDAPRRRLRAARRHHQARLKKLAKSMNA